MNEHSEHSEHSEHNENFQNSQNPHASLKEVLDILKGYQREIFKIIEHPKNESVSEMGSEYLTHIHQMVVDILNNNQEIETTEESAKEKVETSYRASCSI